MFLDKGGNVIEGKVQRPFASGSWTLAGLFAVHNKFGSLAIAEILAPVIALAKKRVVVTEFQAKEV
jgi:gamma-glutamyltranspeptidase/glutathione hydrolase